MTLETVNLDDRRFQEIVDQAKRMIPRYCPEWTDHNVSDPGVALIELFAWMTDLLMYRVNQVPDKMYVKFLELIGVKLEPPRAAGAPVTFYLSAPQEIALIIPRGTEVATVRTETSPAIVFTTEEDVMIRPPRVSGVFTRAASRGKEGGLREHDLRSLELPDSSIQLFPEKPSVGDSFWIALEDDHSSHVMALVLRCEIAGGAGLDPKNPPWVWEVFQGGAVRWTSCEVEYDGTGGFNQDGEIVLHLPRMSRGSVENRNAFWLRCRLTEEQGKPVGSYRVSPEIQAIRLESRGGTALARHAVTVQNEVVGQSDGTPGQRFMLNHSSLLSRDPATDFLILETAGVPNERWTEVTDFADSGPTDTHFTLSGDGTLTLGPSLLQPDGSVYNFGVTPPKGSVLRFSRYQHGGGVIGNVPRAALSVLKTSIPYVARISNRQASIGGRDAQTLEDAKLRAPQTLRTRTRAVTSDDYEYLACQVPGAARAHCQAPGGQPSGPNDPKPGSVLVSVLPAIEIPEGRISQEMLPLAAETRAAVMAHLDARRLIGTTLEVRAPQYVWVSVEAKLRVSERSDPALALEVQAQAEAALYAYLNPYRGGPDGTGWPFGRALHIGEIFSLLQRVMGVEFVDDVKVGLSEPGSDAAPQPAPNRLVLLPYALVCSDRHRVTVT